MKEGEGEIAFNLSQTGAAYLCQKDVADRIKARETVLEKTLIYLKMLTSLSQI